MDVGTFLCNYVYIAACHLHQIYDFISLRNRRKKSFDREGTLKFHYKFFFVVCIYVNIFAKANTNNMNIAVGR